MGQDQDQDMYNSPSDEQSDPSEFRSTLITTTLGCIRAVHG